MPPSNYQIKQGDVIRLEGGCRFEWNFADTGRTAVVGPGDGKLERIYAAILAGERAALELVRPGVQPSELFNAAVAAVRKAGLADYRRHHVGHGIGLEMYEMPLLVPSGKRSDIHDIGKGEMLLEANMVVNVETPYYELGLGGFQIEDTVVVTSSGFEYLTQAPRDIWRTAF